MTKYGKLVGDIYNVVTVEDLLDRYLIEVYPLKAKATYKGNLTQSQYLRTGLDSICVDELKAIHIYQYMDVRSRKAQTNREIALLSHMLKYAIRWRVIEDNPCRNVMRFRQAPQDRYVEDCEYKTFRDFSAPLIAVYMDFNLLTALKKSDILRLKRDSLKEDEVHVYISNISNISKIKQKLLLSGRII